MFKYNKHMYLQKQNVNCLVATNSTSFIYVW